MKNICIFFSFIIAAYSSNAQSAKVIYGELGGPGLASLNFDTRFNGTNTGLGAHVGVGGFTISSSGILLVPAGVNYLLSKDQKNCIELGVGITYVSISSDLEEGSTEESFFGNSFGHLWLGYRLQPIDDGISFRAGISPVFGSGTFIPYYAGISVGYKF